MMAAVKVRLALLKEELYGIELKTIMERVDALNNIFNDDEKQVGPFHSC